MPPDVSRGTSIQVSSPSSLEPQLGLAGQRVLAMERELDRIVEEMDHLDALRRARVEVDDEREVEQALAQALHALARAGLLHAQLDAGVTGAERVDRLRQHRRLPPSRTRPCAGARA